MAHHPSLCLVCLVAGTGYTELQMERTVAPVSHTGVTVRLRGRDALDNFGPLFCEEPGIRARHEELLTTRELDSTRQAFKLMSSVGRSSCFACASSVSCSPQIVGNGANAVDLSANPFFNAKITTYGKCRQVTILPSSLECGEQTDANSKG